MDPWSLFIATANTLGPTRGVREAWHRGRARYAVWLVRLVDPAIEERTARVAAALASHGVVRLHAPSDSHVTVGVCGFPTGNPIEDDDVAEDQLEAQVWALTSARPAACTLWIGGASSFLSCPYLEVHDPEGGLERIRAVLPPDPRGSPSVPHLTLGAYSDHRPTGPIAAALAPFRDLRPLAFRFDAVELVTFATEVPGAPLVTRWRVELGARRP